MNLFLMYVNFVANCVHEFVAFKNVLEFVVKVYTHFWIMVLSKSPFVWVNRIFLECYQFIPYISEYMCVFLVIYIIKTPTKVSDCLHYHEVDICQAVIQY